MMISYREIMQKHSAVGQIFVLSLDEMRLDDSDITHLIEMR